MADILVSLSLIVILAALISLVFRLIRQPPIIAYLITGIISGPILLDLIGPTNSSTQIIQILAHIGVILLLFIVGLNLDFRILKEIGLVSTFGGIIEIIVTGGLGIVIALALGFSNITALYIGAALAFSSTVIVVKILSDKKEIDTLHGRIALGILIVEDFVAAIILMLIPLIVDNQSILVMLSNFGIILLIVVGVMLIANFVLPKFLDYLARNQETFFLFGIAWALLVSTLFDNFGFSSEIGALIAGISLASSKYTLELSGKIKPLRDFFTVLFFVYFGSQLTGGITLNIIYIALIFSIFVVIGKPILVMTILRVFGYKKRTNFLTGSSLAQISEFSLILTLLGFTLGHIEQSVMGIIILIALFTIGLSSYSIYYADSIFSKLSNLLNIFEGKQDKILSKKETKPYKVVLFGYHRVGYKVLNSLKKIKIPFVVVDYNPKVVLALKKQKINCIYGDAGDKYFLSELSLDKVDLIISTIPDEYTNISIIETMKQTNSKAIFMATAEQPRGAIDLYKLGANYVIVPHHLGGDYVANILEKNTLKKEKYSRMGHEHYKELLKSKNRSVFK